MEYYLLIPFLPLGAFFLNILFGKKVVRGKAHWPANMAVFGSFVVSVMVLLDVYSGRTLNEDLYSWIVSGEFQASVGFQIDQLTAVMLIVVTSISLIVHLYSTGYMHGDAGYYRFYSYLSLFTFSMLMLVMANNFLQLYFGWEAVGLCSYLLIGFWYEKKSASDAGKKAFIVNRFGDFGFGLGVIMIFLALGSLHYAPVFEGIGGLAGQTVEILGLEVNLVTLIALLLFCGAVGKSAQIPLHVWLPDAMEGPTPVSALIHAATMVTAGVFMVARCNPIFNLSPTAMAVVAVTGGVTALFAATIALVQNDIKRVIAYSTISQLGYMFLALGVGAYSAGIFHLFTHAYFKALLFLCAGSIMHAMGGEIDMQKMGGLKRYMPVTYLTMLIASFSISGIPGLAGFFSKDEILFRAYASGGPGRLVWILGTLSALLTAFYSFRLIFVTFHGDFRGTDEQRDHLHESPKTMTLPLIFLCLGAIAAGWVGIPPLLGGSEHFGHFLEPVLGHPASEASHAEEWMTMGLSVLAAGGGILLAVLLYLKLKEIPGRLAERFSPVYNILWNKYFIDELYGLIVVRPVFFAARNIIVAVTDGAIIEGIVNGVPALIGRLGSKVRRMQDGVVQHYGAMMAFGLFLAMAVALIVIS